MPKCKGCDKESKSKKGWCSIDCYRTNQHVIENNGRFKKGNILSEKTLQLIGEKSSEWHKNNKEKSLEIIKKMNTSEINEKKGHKKETHHKWITDRTKLKYRRFNSEEKNFTKEILKERSYKCEITNENCNKLSVHHLDSVYLFPEKIFDKNNVIVIKYEIHMDFHRKYGYRSATKEKWEDYLKNNIIKNAS